MRARFLLAAALVAYAAPARADLANAATPVQVEAGLGATTRQLGYRDDVFGSLRGYTLTGAPTLHLGAAVFPGAWVSDGVAARFGLVFALDEVFGVKTARSGVDEELATHARSYRVGLRVRWPIDVHALVVGADYARQTFRVDGGAPFPDVDYQSLRLSLGVRIGLSPSIVLTPELAALPTFSSGAIAGDAWFPRAKTFGMEASLRASFDVGHGVAPYLGVGYRRYLLALHPEPGDAHVAGGASDDFFDVSVGLAWGDAPRQPSSME